jgi:acetylxylan esterase
MLPRLLRPYPTLFSFATVLSTAFSSHAAEFIPVNYGGGANPTMELYVPDAVDESPGVVLLLHYCGGNSGSTHEWLKSAAEQYGFLIIAPDVGPNDCWTSVPTRSGEPAALVKMVQYVIDNEGADKTRVFAAGASSGACMTNALLAAYPDVFSGGSVLAGVAAGAWGNSGSCSVCSQDPPNKTAAQWGDIVREAFAFTGSRPPMQLWHGTGDGTLKYPGQLNAEVAQWTNVFDVTDADSTKEADKPKSGWSRTSYKDEAGSVVLEVNIGQGQPHDLTGIGLWPDVVRFFGLDQDTVPVEGSGGAGSGGAGSGGGPDGVGGNTTGTGGLNGTGSTTAAGGALGAGGAGNVASGGSSGGPLGSGGALGATGGTSATDPGMDDDFVDDGSGCQVGASHRPLGWLGSLLAVAVGALVCRRRRTAA